MHAGIWRMHGGTIPSHGLCRPVVKRLCDKLLGKCIVHAHLSNTALHKERLHAVEQC